MRAGARTHPIWSLFNHPRDAIYTLRRDPLRFFNALQSAIAQCGFVTQLFIHRDKPLRRVAENERRFGAPECG